MFHLRKLVAIALLSTSLTAVGESFTLSSQDISEGAKAEETSIDPTTCKIEAKTTLDYNYCASLREAAAATLLNKYLQMAYGQVPDEGVAYALTQSQEAWKAYKDSHCVSVYKLWKMGSISTLMEYDCRTRVINARTLEIWQSFLTGMGEAGYSVLPKPKFEDQ